MHRKSKILLVGLTAFVALSLARPLSAGHGTEHDPVLSWHTYAGSSVRDVGEGVAVDSSGNVYLMGWSDSTWGNPVQPHSGGRDAFVAKLSSSGELVWNTFLGPTPAEFEQGAIAVDGSGNVFVTGTGEFTTLPTDTEWGHFVAKLNSSGELQWRQEGATTYWGVSTTIAVDATGSIYVGGWGACSSEPGVYIGSGAWVGKLDSSGGDVWHANLACFHGDEGALADDLAVDASGKVYVTGRSNVSWGAPIVAHAGGDDVFVAKLDSDGELQWNTFMGSSGSDEGWGIALDESGNVYVCGHSDATWGTPIRPHGGGALAGFAAKLDSSGVRQWHTFVGDLGWAIGVHGGEKVYLSGVAPVGWHAGGFVATLNSDGMLLWNKLIDAILDEMAVNEDGNVYLAGQSDVSWGTPVNPHAGGWDAFVAKLPSSALAPAARHDFNGDGNADILWHHQGNGGLYTWFLGGTRGVVTQGGSYLTPASFSDTQWQIRGIADFDADGNNDVLWHHQGNGDLYVWFMGGPNGVVTGCGNYLNPSRLSDTRWQIRGIADFDGDGNLDILWHHQTMGDLYVWFLNGLTVARGSYLIPSRSSDTQWQIRGIADFNGDGNDDILWHHQTSGSLYVWFLGGAGGVVTQSGSYLTPASISDRQWKIVEVADFDGDGSKDLLWHHQGNGSLYVWFLGGTGGVVTQGGSYLTPSAFSDTSWKVVPR